MSAAISFLSLPHGVIRFPAFLPDGTQGVVRAVDAADLEAVGVQAVVMNTFHLMQRPGSSTVEALGGLHRMSGWRRPILTDSGGFQAYSIIRADSKKGGISDRGITFKREDDGRKFQLTAEKSIQLQLAYGTDLAICLDEPTHVDEGLAAQAQAVARTVGWARRCKSEFARLVSEKGLEGEARPQLFAVVQGGGSKELRKECAESLLEIGFDGFGYGGWPLDGEGNLLSDMLGYLRELIPAAYPLHALGVGHPSYVVECARMGYGLFDSALPTRDGRRGRLYAFTTEEGLAGEWFEFVHVYDKKFIKDSRPVSEHCDCPACERYSRGYLHHLFKINDVLFYRLATLHNLRFMAQLEGRLREGNE